jgi:hypothetical protein
MSSQPQPPDKDFRAGTMRAAIWRNEIEQDGQTVVRHSVQLTKRYRDRDGQWRDSDTLFVNDLPRAKLVLDKAFEYVVLKESERESDTSSTLP